MMDSSLSWPYPNPNESFWKISEYFYLFEHHFGLAAEQIFQPDWAIEQPQGTKFSRKIQMGTKFSRKIL